MPAGRLVLAVVAAAIASPAIAGLLPLRGAFGNDAGCAFYMSGDRSRPELAVVTPHTLTTHDGGCRFESLAALGGDGFTLGASCSGSLAGARQLQVAGSAATGYHVSIKGRDWGPLQLCPGTEALFDPPGIAV